MTQEAAGCCEVKLAEFHVDGPATTKLSLMRSAKTANHKIDGGLLAFERHDS